MKKTMTVGYQHRQGRRRDLVTAPKLIIVNYLLQQISNISVGDKIEIEYLENRIIIKKLN